MGEAWEQPQGLTALLQWTIEQGIRFERKRIKCKTDNQSTLTFRDP